MPAAPAGRGLTCLLLVLALLIGRPARAGEPVSLFGPALPDTPVAIYDVGQGDHGPSSFSALPAWEAAHNHRSMVDMLGGDYWLVTRFAPTGRTSDWVVTFANTWYEHAQIEVLGSDGSLRRIAISHANDGDFLLRGSARLALAPGRQYAIIVHVGTPFFTAWPRIDVQTMAQYRRRATNETMLMLGALGVLGGLGVFILFVGLWTANRSYVLYGLQALTLLLGWGFFFRLPQEWLGIDTGRVNFTLWFILLPVVHASFTIHFLELQHRAPRLMRVGRGIAVASALALPLALILPSLAFLIATLAVTCVVLFSAWSGAWALTHGVRQARFFTLAYLAVLLPGSIILPANLGLLPSPVDNADLLTLIGNSCEAMLLAFALADHVKLIERGRERFRLGMQDAIARASADALTGLGNRLAFNMAVEEITGTDAATQGAGVWQIAMIDLDGLKLVNDRMGHDRGDHLLQATGAGLGRLGEHTRAFRLGGDEFAVIARGDDLSEQRLAQALTELDCRLRNDGFPDAGISFGICSAPATLKRLGSAEFTALVREADRAMYAHKSRRHGAQLTSSRFSPG